MFTCLWWKRCRAEKFVTDAVAWPPYFLRPLWSRPIAAAVAVAVVGLANGSAWAILDCLSHSLYRSLYRFLTPTSNVTGRVHTHARATRPFAYTYNIIIIVYIRVRCACVCVPLYVCTCVQFLFLEPLTVVDTRAAAKPTSRRCNLAGRETHKRVKENNFLNTKFSSRSAPSRLSCRRFRITNYSRRLTIFFFFLNNIIYHDHRIHTTHTRERARAIHPAAVETRGEITFDPPPSPPPPPPQPPYTRNVLSL